MQEQRKEKGGREGKEKQKIEGKEEKGLERKGRQGRKSREGRGPVTQRALSLQESKGYDFESETDTESIAKLVKYMYDNRDSDDISFTTLVERVIQQLVMLGAGCGWAHGGRRGDRHPPVDRQTDTQNSSCTPVLPRVAWPVQRRACRGTFCGWHQGAFLPLLPLTIHLRQMFIFLHH